jgi:hypothetical protein
MLYAGTDNAVYFSRDDGASWQSLQLNLPPAPVYWIAVQEHFDDLVIGTYGRGFYILDDLSAVRENTSEVAAEDAHLFRPRDAYRFRSVAGVRDAGSFVNGENPPYGAAINFSLKAAPAQRVELTISGADGKPIRTMSLQGRAGMNRVWWNLRYDSVKTVALRTPPPDAEWVAPGPDGTRRLVVWRGSSVDPLVLPGTYTVRLRVAGKEQTQPLTVLRDPGSGGSLEEMQKQLAFALDVRGDVTTVVEMLNSLEWTRKQIIDIRAMLASDPQFANQRSAADGGAPPGRALTYAANELEKKIIAVQNQLEDTHLTGYTEDSFRHPMGIFGKYSTLGSDIINSGADLRPTNQQVEVRQELLRQLEKAKKEFEALKAGDVPAFNSALKANGFGGQVKP